MNTSSHDKVYFRREWLEDLRTDALVGCEEKAAFEAAVIRYLGYLKGRGEKATYGTALAFLEAVGGVEGTVERRALHWFFLNAKRNEGKSRKLSGDVAAAPG